MADKREFLVVIDGKESVSPAAGKAERSLDHLGDQAKKTERDFDGLDRKMREHADTITHLQNEIVKTGDTKLFGELGKSEREFKKLDGLKKALTGAAGDAAPDMAVTLSSRLGPLLARLPVSGPLAIGLGAAAAAAAPAIGASIAGAIVGGVGIGGVVGGVMLAGSDPRVKAATSGLANQIGEQLADAAKPFVPAVVHAVAEARHEFLGLDDELRSIFRNSSKNLEPLAEGASSGIVKIVQGFEKLNRSAGPTIREIGAGLHDLGAEVGRVLGDLADNGGEAADAMRNLFTIINGGVRVVGGTVNGLTELYGILRKVQAAREGDFATLAGYTNAQIAAQDALDGTAGSLEGVNIGARAAAAAINAYVTAQRSAVDGAITAREANLNLREAIVQAGEAADGKKKVSLEEERALIGLIRATNDSTVAMDGSKVSAGEAAKTFETNRAKVIAMAEKMGYSKKQARELADQMLKIPNVKADVKVDQRPAVTAVRNIQRAINGLHGKVIRNIIVTGELGGNDQGAMHGMSEGGLVGGGGPPGKDTQIRALASDEFVLTGAQVRAAGGPGAVESALKTGGAGGVVAAPPRAVSGPLVLQVSPTGFAGMERMFLSWLIKAVQNAGGSTAALRL